MPSYPRTEHAGIDKQSRENEVVCGSDFLRPKRGNILFFHQKNDIFYLQYVSEKIWRPNSISRNINFVLPGSNPGDGMATEYQFCL